MSFLDRKKKRYEELTKQEREEFENMTLEDSQTLTDGLNFIVENKYPVPKLEKDEMEKIKFPNDISGMPDDILLEEMNKWTLLIDFMQFELSKADTDKIAKSNRYTVEKSKFIISAVEDGLSMEMARHHSNVDYHLAMLLKSYEVARAKYNLIDALLKGYNQNYKLLSRELTKRGLYNPTQDNKRSLDL